ncbi:DinB family protein [Sphingobacterium shayense]|uniref:DinB family protein n=1 Tax=Sphingobacterium shayense TaxID=626343 RepID=UPI001552B1A5|nr:DinB family protein [Sphingobacterium shayense]NQD69687.1 DinB family protein [Sphingobacterium shayense]
MEKEFKFIIDTRKAFISLVDGLSIDELNQIPEGFNNNIAWNFGHIVVSTQTLCYVRTGIKSDVTDVKYVQAYKKDTKPTYFISAAEIHELKSIAIASIEKIQLDYQNGLFANVTPFSTSTYGSTLATFDDVLITTIGHDNLHLGYAQALRRAIKSNKQQSN